VPTFLRTLPACTERLRRRSYTIPYPLSPFLMAKRSKKLRPLARRARRRPVCEACARGRLAVAGRVQARGDPADGSPAASRHDGRRPWRRARRVEPVRRPCPGRQGAVIALDVLEMPAVPGVEFIQGDFTDEAVLARLEAALGARRSIL